MGSGGNRETVRLRESAASPCCGHFEWRNDMMREEGDVGQKKISSKQEGDRSGRMVTTMVR